MDYAKIAAELEWLQSYPHFQQKPADMPTFLGEGYLDIAKGIRPGVRGELVEIFGKETNPTRIANYEHGMFTGAIGIGKTTMASVILPYMAHWVLCLKDPQDYYDLLPGSRIAFMQMSTSEDQAIETVFGDIKARIEHCQWFLDNYNFDSKFTKQIRFKQKDIWILPGNSAETTFEGYNILGGILDEADSHKKTKEKDYAEVGYDTIDNRISSRFQDRGFFLVVGQMKSSSGFAATKYEEFQKNPRAHTVRMTIWESLGWQKFSNPDGSRNSFWYDKSRKEIVPKGMALLIEATSENLIEVPEFYRDKFENNPEKALRDLAGIPPMAGDPFISLTYKIDEALQRWQDRYENIGSPVSDSPTRPQFEKWFKAPDSLKRAVHLDIAYSAEGDALGLSMGHVNHLVEVDGDLKPYIVMDFLLRIKAAPGTEIMLSDARRYIYDLKEELGFKIRGVSMDGFQSTEMKQQLRKRRFFVEYLSVDKSKLPYEDLRDALYEDRIEFPPYFTYLTQGADKKVQIAVKELSELEDGEKKIDHPTHGSKDVSDTIAGVVTTLMGDRTYRRGVRSSASRASTGDLEDQSSSHPQSKSRDPYSGLIPGGLNAPVPPSVLPGQVPSMPLPPGLIRRDR